MEWLFDPQAWIALATLTALEIVLGIDNIIFISILVGRLPQSERQKGRLIGLSLAMVARIALLLSLTWIMQLTAPLFTVMAQEISGRDIILLAGGLFLIAKSTFEIHSSLEGPESHQHKQQQVSFIGVLVQIALIDIVFSFDSVITAVGLAQHVQVMIIAIIIAVLVMMVAAKSISDFVDRHPSVKMLALSFLVMIGTTLVAEGLDFHIPKGYIYFAMAFSFGVEMLNMRRRSRQGVPVTLHRPLSKEEVEE
ncbi:TerC family protein [Zooshikella harenae]|uniref:TerC family protein n=1 Tax=Zooshikella harenae TaxID=2827238 RepID=A0ABS5ZFQ7_9GAMM|nr:TerC family protein [Zooshikella harenae]MBU2712884.1 TerC family protein [Zooshikella harenae]